MKNLLIDILETFGYPVFLQGSLAPTDAYPDNFITFWTDYTADDGHFDNKVAQTDWSFSVIFYSNNPVLTNTKPPEIIAALKNAGFISQGKGQDIPSDEPTHTGWAMDFIYVENENLF